MDLEGNINSRINRNALYWLRWTAVLPLSLLAGFIALIPLHLVVMNSCGGSSNPDAFVKGDGWMWLEKLLSPLVLIAVSIYVGGAKVAPEFHKQVAVAIALLWTFILGGLVFLTLGNGTWFGNSLEFQNGGLTTALAILGIILGVVAVWRGWGNNEQT